MGSAVAIGTFRPGVVIIIPEGSSSGWDIPKPVDVIQLYLPHATLERVAGEVDSATSTDLLERTAHPDPITSRLLLTATDAVVGNVVVDTLFRHQLMDLLATRLLAAHVGAPSTFQPTRGGLSPVVLRRAIERLHSDIDADVSLATLASDAGLSRFHFCRAFKEEHRAFPTCLAAPATARGGQKHAARHRRVGHLDRGRARLFFPDRVRRRLQEADRGYPEQLATACTLTASPMRGTASLRERLPDAGGQRRSHDRYGSQADA